MRAEKLAEWVEHASGGQGLAQGASELHFPTTRDERWRYTRAGAIVGRPMRPAAAGGQAPDSRPLACLDAWRLVFVDGHFDPANSTLPGADDLAEGVFIGPVSEGSKRFPEQASCWGHGHFSKTEWFAALQSSSAQDGACILVPAHIDLSSRPILIEHHLSGPGIVSHPRNILHIQQGAKAEILLWTSSDVHADGLVNLALDARVEADAELKLEYVQDEQGRNAHISHLAMTQLEGSRLDMHTATARAHWLRNDVRIEQIGERGVSNFNGCFAAAKDEFVDHHTHVDHVQPDGRSAELYKGLALAGGKAVFNGKIVVHPDAQRIEAFQKNSNILLERGSSVYAKPELEIYADDVRCSHGCTTGQFDEDALFYLRSRGLPEPAAKRLLTQAFLSEALNGARAEVRAHVEAVMLNRINPA
jgi:Fe-S cluster assembly protein SufD